MVNLNGIQIGKCTVFSIYPTFIIFIHYCLVRERNFLGDLSSGMAFDNRCSCTEQIAECRCGVRQSIKFKLYIFLLLKYFYRLQECVLK